MFSLLNGIYDSYLAPVQLNVLVVGGPGSGKTAFLERLKVTEIPTRPKGGSKAMTERMVTINLTPNLERAFADTGATNIQRRMMTEQQHVVDRRQRSDDRPQSPSRRNGPSHTEQVSSSTTVSSVALPKRATVTVKQKKRFSFCPAPERYLKAATTDDGSDDEIDGEERGLTTVSNNNNNNNNNSSQNVADGGGRNGSGGWEQEILDELNNSQQDVGSVASDAPQRVRCHSKELDMESLDLMDGRRSSMQDIPLDQPLTKTTTTTTASATMQMHPHLQMESQSAISTPSQTSQRLRRRNSGDGDKEGIRPPPLSPAKADNGTTTSTSMSVHQHRIDNPPLRQTSSEEYNMKTKAVMLPLRMIRPTIGTNLKKLDMYSAQCHCFDVGGKLQDLWQRYYDDCDAVIFCWRLGSDPDDPKSNKKNQPNSTDGSGSDSDDEDDPAELYMKQQTILNEVRKSIPDEVPFLILGHVFGNVNVETTDRMYSTDLLLPHYHNPMTSMCCASAKTGAGVQSAMDWLIPLAKRQQKERQQERRHFEEKQL